MDKPGILVMGASSDIGSALIHSIAGQGHTVFAHYHQSREKIDLLVQEFGAGIVPMQADLSDAADTARLGSRLRETGVFIEKVVHLPAPSASNVRFKDCDWSVFEKELHIQLRSAVCLLRELLPEMANRKAGRVLFLLSSYTQGVPPSALSHYITAKFALLGLMRALAAEYSGKSVTVNAVSPSMVETRFLANIPERLVELVAQGHPLKRNAKPSDVVGMMRFLLSEEAAYITGQNVAVAGGSVF